MGTTKKMLHPVAVSEMVADLKDYPSIGNENGGQEIAVGPFTTFYFLYDTKQSYSTILDLIEIYERFNLLVGSKAVLITHPESQRQLPTTSPELPDFRKFARKLAPNDHFLFTASNEENVQSSPLYAARIWKMPAYMNDKSAAIDVRYSFVQLYYSWDWWLEHKMQWREFLEYAFSKLNPYVAYSGFAVGNPVEVGTRADAAVWERALAPHFYGLDIDYPIGQNQLGFGIRTPTWGFFLSDALRERLQYTREQVRDYLSAPEIRIDELPAGQWIELGDEPKLHPVEDGLPALPALLNRMIRPLRDDQMSLLGFAQWEDDPNERFSDEDGVRWMRRFDGDSDWPSAQQRAGTDPAAAPPVTEAVEELRARSEQPCPRTGYWSPVESPDQKSLVKQGNAMPSLQSGYGYTVWRFAHD